MSIATPQAERRVLLWDVSWATFLALARDSHGGRLAYDRGRLEIMSPSYRHESVKGLIGRMVEAYAEERDIDIATAGSTTLTREDLLRGIEPDESYYLANASRVRGQEDIELPVDPPPDLAIEVDITRSSLDKLSIYAGLGVTELWRYDGAELTIFVLQDSGEYQRRASSIVLPHFPVDELNRLLQQRDMHNETALVRMFRRSLRLPGTAGD